MMHPEQTNFSCEYLTAAEPASAELVSIGINHQTAPVELRERFSLIGEAMQDWLYRQIIDVSLGTTIQEAVILATCNRFEVYLVAVDVQQCIQEVETYLHRMSGIAQADMANIIYVMQGDAVIQHVMRVAAGVESMILGEQQILGQVSKAQQQSADAGICGAVLSHLFTQAVHSGKRARTETEISTHTTSISHAAVKLAQSHVGDLSLSHALIVGTGEMAVLAAQALERHQVRQMTFINRTYSKADQLAAQFNGEALDWHFLLDALYQADVVIAATGAPHTVIQQREIRHVMEQRPDRPLVLLDIALPRDIEDGIKAIAGAYCYDLDSLQTFVDANLDQRKAAIDDVQAIVDVESTRFTEWKSGHQAASLIQALRQKANAVAQAELEAALRKMDDLDEAHQKVLERMTHRIVNKLLHDPTIWLRSEAVKLPCYSFLVQDLFSIEVDHK